MSVDTSAGTLWFVNADDTACELLNDERTRHYQSAHPLWNGRYCADCACPILDYNPVSGALLTYGASPDVAPYAPWYDSSSAASAEFLGYVVSTIDGLDYANYGRTINQRALDGANLTPMRASGREITFTLIGTALTERGMRYGLDWLAANLLSLGGRCDSGRIVVRLFCDQSDYFEPLSGAVELREVALSIAPSWTTNYLAENGCLVREARFTMVAGDPCMYGATTYCPLDGGGNPTVFTNTLLSTSFSSICAAGHTVKEFVCGPLPVDLTMAHGCATANMPWCEIDPGSAIEANATAVTIEVPLAGAPAGPFSVMTFVAPPGTPCATVFADPLAYLGRVNIGRLYAGQAVMIDGVSGSVWFRASPSAAWQADDMLLIISDDEYPTFPRLAGCDAMFVAIRPFAACVSGGTFHTSFVSTRVLGCTLSLDSDSACSGCVPGS